MPNTNPSHPVPAEAQRPPSAALNSPSNHSSGTASPSSVNVIEPPEIGQLRMSHAASLKSIMSAYLKPADIAKVEVAFEMARLAHEGQTRQSGEPYITHPLAVATLLAQWHLDAQALIAAILHDVVEDTPTTKDDIAQQFGKAVADLVDGV
jgi:(p)ppGpp synthase/HD superfamily hydrolase